MNDDHDDDPSPAMSDLIGFEVEGHGYYLVPLTTLSAFRVPPRPDSVVGTGPGWGWKPPTVRWNSFHAVQIGTEITLAPGIIASLGEHHFPNARLQG